MPEVQLHHDGHPKYRRMVRFDWSDTPLHWVPDDPFSTHMMNVLHLLLPEGERHFIKAVLEASSLVDDPELEAAIKPFIQQESWHAWAHQVVLDHLAEQGIDTKPYTDRLGKIAIAHTGRSAEVPPQAATPVVVATVGWPTSPPSSTSPRCSGNGCCRTEVSTTRGTDPTMLDLLRWHGAEEVEHRSLVFDVYQNVCGSYWIRALSMLTTAPLFIGWWIAGARYLMANDKTIDAKWRWRDWLRAAREYRLPGPWYILGGRTYPLLCGPVTTRAPKPPRRWRSTIWNSRRPPTPPASERGAKPSPVGPTSPEECNYPI